jgi:hypothetical protein
MQGLRPEHNRDNQAGVVLNGPTQINITIKDESQKGSMISKFPQILNLSVAEYASVFPITYPALFPDCFHSARRKTLYTVFIKEQGEVGCKWM